MPTGVVALNSDLQRKKWLRQGLLQASSNSFWSAYTSMSKDSIVYQVNNESASSGHTVVFDFDGNLSGRAIPGKQQAYGNGEQKRKFSDRITVERYRLVVDNGDKFDATNVGDLSIAQHEDSRAKLADLFIRFKDQALFDTAQGYLNAATPTHSIQIDASITRLSYTNLVDIERTLRTGQGYMTGAFGSITAAPRRAPLQPYRLKDGRSIWLMIIDPDTAANLKGNTATGGIMTLATTADLRGDGNRVFKGLLGRVGQLVIVEAEVFFGASINNTLAGSEIEIAGMRQYNAVTGLWSGEAGFTTPTYSRNLILGAGAMQMAFGKQPDYKWQPSSDFGIKSESAVEFWMNSKKVNMTAENLDYKAAQRANIDYGVIPVDVKLV